jgi:hypothetical protein
VEFIKTELQGKRVILLNGARTERTTAKSILIEAPEKLLEAARQNPDAVAFGYMSGKWWRQPELRANASCMRKSGLHVTACVTL